MKNALVVGDFDDFRLSHLRLLRAAAKIGPLHIFLRSDEAVARVTGKLPKFPEAERRYLLESIRYVHRVTLISAAEPPIALSSVFDASSAVWVVDEASHSADKLAYCRMHNLEYRVLEENDLTVCLAEQSQFVDAASARKRVIVTGCYDWFHSGHVRFFEEVAELGDLYVVVGHDANIRLLKGEGHPLFSENERRFMVQAVRFVKASLISSGDGWLDAEPEIERIKPHIYAVNEDGDRPEKRSYCESRGIEYRVLKRLPKQGLPQRQSTKLRGF
jgi:cytidyltransferase-like protein